MSFGNLLRLPPAIIVAFVPMLWPAIWAAAATVMAHDTFRRPAKSVVHGRG
jgi:hypothetical protein